MADDVSHGALDWVATAIVNWRALSLKRLVQLDELERTGRWQRHYKTREAFQEALRSANTDAERWKQLADQHNVAAAGRQ